METKPLSAGEFSGLLDLPAFDLIRQSPESPVALAVSGGPDSMALAALVSGWLREKGRVPAHALIVDHGLRPESAAEARRVKGWLEALPGLHPRILRWTGDKPAAAIMEKARAARYRLLEHYCARHEISGLFLAHHRDDQAETVLIRLAKGSGLDGLSGMARARKSGAVTLLRPFLDCPKARLVATCRALGVPFVEDPSNANPAWLRPRLRTAREVLEKEGLDSKRLAQTAARLARARSALDAYARQACDAARWPGDDTARVRLDCEILARCPEETRLRAILLALADLAPGFSPAAIRMERFESLVGDLFAPAPFRKRTLGGFVFSRRDRAGEIVIAREEKNKTGKVLLEI